MPKTWFQFTNTAASEAEISIYDAIGFYGVSAKAFIDELKKVAGKKLTVRINSPGGVVTEGLAIFNALKRHKGGVIVEIDALAASMATYIALAGAPLRMAENAFFMIHNVNGGAYGTPAEMRQAADVAEKIQKGIVAAYVAKTGKTAEEVEEKMDEETWFTAEEAKDFGFIDEITPAFEAAACLGEEGRALLAKFRRAPAALVDMTAETKPAPTTPSPMKLLTAALAVSISTLTGSAVTETSTETEIKAALDGLAGKVTGLEGEKKSLGEKVTALEGEKKQLGDKVTALEGEKGTLTAEVTKLKGESKSTDQKAQELAAAHNSLPGSKDAETAAGGAKDGKALYDQYSKLDGREAAEFWDKHSKELIAFGKAEEARARQRD
jgi:ATP-dependent Clp endopeptidase proteolytic subunit ClpP